MSDPDDAPSGGGPEDRGPSDERPYDTGSNDGSSADGGPDDEELAEMADDLSDVLRDLRDELRASREARVGEPVDQPSGFGGVDIPDVSIDLPSATDVLAFTDEKLIPAAITILEVNIKALELLQKGIRWARPDRAGENARAVQSHAESVSRSTLQRLDTVLADLQEAAGEGALPENAEASGIITEARRLRDEIDHALEERAEARGESQEPDTLPGDVADVDDGEEDGPPSPWDDQPEVDVDVEGELQSIKAELGKVDDEEDADDPTDDAHDGAESVEDDEGDDEADRVDDGTGEVDGDGNDEPSTVDGDGSADESGSGDDGDVDGGGDGQRDPANEAETGEGADRDDGAGDAGDGSDSGRGA